MTSPFPPVPGAATNLHGLKLVAATASAGFALQNATPVIVSWTAPADGKMHAVLVFAIQDVTLAQTGGSLGLNLVMPDGNAYNPQVFGGGAGPGGHNMSFSVYLIQPGSVFQLQQTGALTAGACLVWAELWAS